MAGYPGKARWVGTVLSKLPAHTQVPWHRVVNAQGILTCPRADLATKRLISEGVSVRNSRVSMKKHRWSPEQPAGKVADSTED
jgi:methylated-DNA-protein-cysteine methyltransferase-like protein